jgi:hypothetical protein
MSADDMTGERVCRRYVGTYLGTVAQYEPLSAAMCDVLVRADDGAECWWASHELAYLDGRALPDRGVVQAQRAAVVRWQLQAIRARLVAEWHQPWPGAEHGKAIVGRALDAAIASVPE